MATAAQTIVLGSGCFWCLEEVLSELKGIIKVEPGYAGGSTTNPTYEQVLTGATAHAEVVQAEFDPSIISLTEILSVFFATHDPTQLNRQGHDVGTQYRSIILYTNEEQRVAAEQMIKQLEQDKVYNQPIVTEIKPLEKFYPAEKYHQHYYRDNQDQPYCQVVINPKLAKLRAKFSALLK